VSIVTRIGHGDFVALIGVKPNLSSSALEHAGGKPLLQFQRNHASPSLTLQRGETNPSFVLFHSLYIYIYKAQIFKIGLTLIRLGLCGLSSGPSTLGSLALCVQNQVFCNLWYVSYFIYTRK